MDTHNTEAITNACTLILNHMNPLREIKEDANQYVPLYCYTATSSYALGLTRNERQEVVMCLRNLFDFFCNLTVEKDGRFHAEWTEYARLNRAESHIDSVLGHRSRIANFTEGNTFVCIGSPDSYCFNDKEQGLEVGEITYVIYGMYNFLKHNTDYDDLIKSDIKEASDLYESIINNPRNRRVYLRMRLKKTDIAYLSDVINDDHRATVELIDDKVSFLCNHYLKSRKPHMCSEAACSAMLNSDYQFAKPLGNCKYELCEGIEEIKDIIFEREMASAFVKLISIR